MHVTGAGKAGVLRKPNNTTMDVQVKIAAVGQTIAEAAQPARTIVGAETIENALANNGDNGRSTKIT